MIFSVEHLCQNCFKSYKNKCSLSRHLKYECGKQPMHKCPYCTKRCSLKENLKKHIIFMHKQILDFSSYTA